MSAEGASRAVPSADEGTSGRQATIYDVAKAAGVSHQTVSRYLKGFPGIRPATRERVVDAVNILGYRPNLTARSLTTGRSHRLGALTHEIDQVGPSRIAQGASSAAREAGYLLDVVTLDMSNAGAIDDALELVRQHDLAGILALSSTDEMTAAFEHTSFRVPVFIAAEQDDLSRQRPSEFVTRGLPALIDHLAALGHRRFLHVAGPQTWAAARNRMVGYDSALEARGLHSAGVLFGDWSAKSAYDAIRALGNQFDATAVVAANDQMALGAIRALVESGLSVPADVSVTGIDDIPESGYFLPPLTTLSIDFADQGKSAVRELISRINGVAHQDSVHAHSKLVIRGSTGPARPSAAVKGH